MLYNHNCRNIVGTKENPEGDCIEHLIEGRIYSCPYNNQKDAERCKNYKERKE